MQAIRSQDQLGARKWQRRAADLATKAGGITAGLSSQIHIHDHVVSKSQGRGAHGVDAHWRGQAAPGKPRRGLAKARKLLASQGRSGAARLPQRWPAGLVAVRTDEGLLHGEFEQMSRYLRGTERGDELNRLSQLGPPRPDKGSYVEFYVEEEQPEGQPKRRELRKLLDVKDRKKVQFRPTPSRVGLKFKNKSEEERYLKLVTKILQMEHMSRPQVERTLLAVKRFLKEYLALIKYKQVASLQYRRQSEGDVDEVDSLMVAKFIKVIKSMNAPE